jgi:CHASE3 domain sensor protein
MKNSRPLLLSRPFVIASLITGFALAFTTAVLTTVSTREISSASRRTTDTQDTLLDINQLLSSLIDTETGQRGYILTGLEDYLEPYNRARVELSAQMTRLRERLASSPEQLKTLDRMENLIAEKQAEMTRTIEFRRADTIAPALHIMDSGAGLKTMNALRAAVHELEERELSDLARYSAAVGRRATFFQLLGLTLVVAACVVAGLVGRLLMQRMRELESMITVCAWTHRVKFNGRWVSFEEYLRNRFNLRFTHGISEEASKKLQMDAVEFVKLEKLKAGPRTAFPAGKGAITPSSAAGI